VAATWTTIFRSERNLEAAGMEQPGRFSFLKAANNEYDLASARASEHFRDREVIIVPDHDAAGARKAWEAADALHGVAASVRVVTLPGLTGQPKHKDVSDWLDADPSRADTLADLGVAAPVWTPGPAPPDAPDESTPTDTALLLLDAGDVYGPIPARGWLLRNVLCRRFVSSLIADGGVGKTALRLAQLLSLATGKPLTGEHVFTRCRVSVVSLEDDVDELRRRLRAACLHHSIERDDLKGWLFLAAPGAAGGKIMTIDAHGRPIVGTLAAKLSRAIAEYNIDVISLDPFVKTHSVEENSNSMIDYVVQVLADLAVKHNIAVDVPHHAAKGPADPGNANRGRGASAMKDAARLVYTLSPMTPEEAQTFGISEADRRRLIRMDSAKVNIAPPIPKQNGFA
jgi:hypothetical protein